MAISLDSLKNAKDFKKRIERVLVDEAERLSFWDSLRALSNGELSKQLRHKVLRKNTLRVWGTEQENALETVLKPSFDDAKHSDPSWLSYPSLSSQEVRELGELPIMGQGYLFVQEAGASEVVENMNIRPHEKVLDLCAAPGAKSTQILEKLQHQGELYSNEPDYKRVQKLDALLARHGAENITVFSAQPSQLSPYLSNSFDAVLVDAPCSGESFFAKRAEKRRDVRDFEVRACQKLQIEILAHAALMAKPTARLMYSTCTYSREENEDVVEMFLQKHPDWKLQKQQRRWPHRDGVPGGYWAYLTRENALSEAQEPVESVPDKFILRKALLRADEELDEYAASMSVQRSELRQTIDLLNVKEVQSFLRGESLMLGSDRVQEGSYNVDVMWQGRSLGWARKVENRLNNMLPKTLRV